MDISAPLSCAVLACILVFPPLAAPAQNQSPAPPAANNDVAYRKLDHVLPFIQRRNAKDYAADPIKGGDESSYVSIGGTPGYTVEDLNNSIDGQMLTADHLVPQTRSATMKDLGLKLTIPIFFFEGTEGFIAPTDLAREYLQAIQAPQKKFVPIPGGHFAVFMNSDHFLDQLVAQIAPLASHGR
jgi:pimeloyl-ACP methyl ester carboxylesterase